MNNNLCRCSMCLYGVPQHCLTRTPLEPVTAADIRLALLTPEQLVAEVDAQIRKQLTKEIE